MTDEREDLPSASGVPRYDACNGSYLLSRGVKSVQTAENKAWAESGDRIHLWLEAPDFATLEDPQELEVAELCLEQRDGLIKKVFADSADFVQAIKEDRLWIKSNRKRVFSGKADDIRIYGDTGLIVDFKTNRGDIPESHKNLQLRTLAVLLHRHEDYRATLRRIYVAIIQPLVNREPLITCYEVADLERAYDELMALITIINHPDAPRVAGDQCKFCPAKFKCPEAAEFLKKFGDVKPGEVELQRLAELLNDAAAAKAIIKALESRAKQLLKDDPACIPGWMLGKPGSVRSITDPFGVFKLLSDAALLTRDQFLTDCVSVGIGDLEKALIKFNKFKPKEAKDKINDVCGPFIELKAKEPSLEKVE